MEILNTNQVEHTYLKVCVYGRAGAGKTHLIQTASRPFGISAEGGFLSLQGTSIDYTEVRKVEDLREVWKFFASGQAKDRYDWVCVDSLSEIAEIIFQEKIDANPTNTLKAYNETNKSVKTIIRMFRDLPFNIYMTAKAKHLNDENGVMLWQPSMPSKGLSLEVSHYFDILCPLLTAKDEEGNIRRALQCKADGIWDAKDRSSQLNAYEPPDLSALHSKAVAGLMNQNGHNGQN